MEIPFQKSQIWTSFNFQVAVKTHLDVSFVTCSLLGDGAAFYFWVIGLHS